METQHTKTKRDSKSNPKGELDVYKFIHQENRKISTKTYLCWNQIKNKQSQRSAEERNN